MSALQARPTITLFHTDGCEWQTVSPIAEEAERRGFPIRFSSDLSERVQIGVYCQHASRPNAALSVIMLHDLAQRHDVWPTFWSHEPWDAFDIGLLPGEAWVQRWHSQAGQAGTSPRLGVFNVGWPKADLVYRDQQEFREKSAKLRQQLGLTHPQTVLYAPSWENNGKQDDFVRQLVDLPVNLLLKQAPWPAAYPEVLENIRQMNALHRGLAENVHIVDTSTSIMYCIGVSDLLVSDESSVLIEAALHGVPSLAVTDWLIPDRSPPRYASVPFDNVQKTTRTALRGTVEALLSAPALARSEAIRLRDHHFNHFGQSSQLVVDLIEAGWEGRKLPFSPLQMSASAVDRARYRQAEQQMDQNNTAGAIAILAQLVVQDSDCWQAYNDLGAIYFNQQDTEGALALLGRAVEKEGKAGLALQNLAAVQVAAGQGDAAILSYARLLEVQLDNSANLTALSELLASGQPLTPTACRKMLQLLCSHK